MDRMKPSKKKSAAFWLSRNENGSVWDMLDIGGFCSERSNERKKMRG